MSNAEKMVSVPRDPLSQALELCKFTLPDRIYLELYAALSKPAEQHQGEPVAIIGSDWQLLWFSPMGMETLAACCKRTGLNIGDKLYRNADAGEVERDERAEFEKHFGPCTWGEEEYEEEMRGWQARADLERKKDNCEGCGDTGIEPCPVCAGLERKP